MPREKKRRRFEPRYGVSALMLDEEAKTIEREVKDYELLAHSDLNKKRDECHALLKQSWEHQRSLLADLPERADNHSLPALPRSLTHLGALRRSQPGTAPDAIGVG